jgi:sulfotransferase family protein
MMPTFMVPGAPRSGTTSIYHYLRQHSQVFMSPVKETNFFGFLALQRGLAAPGLHAAPRPIQSLEAYQDLFAGAGGAKAIGEASPMYFWTAGVPSLIKEFAPDVRLIFILRNPIDRAYSSYLKACQDRLERRSFEEAARAELSAPEQWPNTAIGFYVRIGFYQRFLAEYFREFSPEQIRIFLFDDLEASPAAFMMNVLTFLGVDPGERLDTSARFNTTQAVQADVVLRKYGLKSSAKKLQATMPAWLYRAIYRGYAGSLKQVVRVPALSRSTRELLQRAYRAELPALHDLTGRDLSAWFEA